MAQENIDILTTYFPQEIPESPFVRPSWGSSVTDLRIFLDRQPDQAVEAALRQLTDIAATLNAEQAVLGSMRLELANILKGIRSLSSKEVQKPLAEVMKTVTIVREKFDTRLAAYSLTCSETAEALDLLETLVLDEKEKDFEEWDEDGPQSATAYDIRQYAAQPHPTADSPETDNGNAGGALFIDEDFAELRYKRYAEH